ncbi:uncharacterized protein [Solanum tuberosum]|uniref:uncharacterized protein n=1 Tax=Solanum tuberosum TaxID=4113 RepID=UPI000739FDAF|nr:PREDICTED: uncharacterized protein LOC107059523 [Solanum tuberosum]
MDIHSHDVDQILELSGDSLTGTSSKSFPMLENDIVQGIDDDLEIIIIRLTGRLSDLEIVTILGMHGINKTTLAKKAYDQLTISYHFDILSWVTILKNLEVEMYKTHLVAKAFTKHPGLNYHSTFSPVVKPAIVRLVLTIATQLYWHADQLDVNNAFLQGLPTEVVYMRQPPGFGNSGSPTHVCYLQKLQLPITSVPSVLCDNINTTYICANLVFHSRMKLVAIDIHFVCEQVEHKQLEVAHLHVADHVVDLLTKHLPREIFGNYFSKFGVVNLDANLRGPNNG